MIALLLFACWWPSPAPSPSQPLIVEVSLGDTADTRMAPTVGATEAEAQSEAVGASAKAGPGEPEAKADPGLGGAP
jgi:hypothetical protein